MLEHWYTWLAAAFLAFAVAAVPIVLVRRYRWSGWRRVALFAVTGAFALIAVLLAIPGVYFFWAQHRSPPAAVARELQPGINYERIVHSTPRPMVVHVMSIDLATPGLEFVVTPRSPVGEFSLKARTTSAFAREFDCDAAINANYFRPFRSNTPWDYYPHAGDGCDVLGLAQSNGDRYGDTPWREGVVSFTNDVDSVRVEIDPTSPSTDKATSLIAGANILLRDGQAMPIATDELAVKPYPRAALGLNRERTRMTWIVIDGKQIGYSEGATLAEFTQMLKAMNLDAAVRLDEGGSATLVGRDESGDVGVLNTPTNTRIIGRERPVANHVGVRIVRTKTSTAGDR